MRSKLQNITSRFLAILMVVGLCVTNSSCTDPETTDSTKFALFYAGITDIGPSMSFNLDAPTYIGGAPSDFAITRVTLNGETYDTNSFAIDTNTGSISLSNTSELPVGLYTLSVSCYSNGNYYEFKDIVTINMMKPVPDSISVEPNKISAEFADIISTESTVELPTAQVTTEGDHISIQKYIIANVRKDGVLVEENDFFTISSTGEISIVKGESKIQPGKYVLDLKLTTAIVDEAAEEGIFEKYLFLPANPNLVLMDTDIITKSPVRLTVAGMGDALATYFEARACKRSGATSCAGGKTTEAAMALAKLCFDTLMEEGVKAKIALEAGVCTPAVEKVIEANTLLSGIGFESAGLAGAHAIHNGFTVLEECHHMYHGEKVAFGTLTQLVLENVPEEELEDIILWCIEVGLPVTLAELGAGNVTDEQLMEVAKTACAENDTLHNMPFEVTPETVFAAIKAADAYGKYYLGEE